MKTVDGIYDLFEPRVYLEHSYAVISFLPYFKEQEIHINLKDCAQAIENIKSERGAYATEEAYNRRLNAYTMALNLLKQRGNV